MTDTKLGEVLELAGRLAGRDVAAMGVPASWKAIAGFAITEGIRRLAAEKFPMMQRVEFRRYRPEYDYRQNYRKGQEVWYSGAYWRLDDATAAGTPGTADGWRKLRMEELNAFIAFRQPWELTAIDPGGIDLKRFAYAEDPRDKARPVPLKAVAMNALGVELEAPAPEEGVFCVFVPEYPTIAFTDWTQGETCDAGEVRYMAATKDVYQALEDGVTVAPNTVEGREKWQTLRVDNIFALFLARLVASDLMTEDQGKYQTQALAEKEFENLQARYMENIGAGGERCRGRYL